MEPTPVTLPDVTDANKLLRVRIVAVDRPIEQAAGQGRTMAFVPINQNSPGTTVLVAANSQGRIKVVSYLVVLDAAGTLKFTGGATDLTGTIPAAANGGVAFASQPTTPILQTEANTALSITTTGGSAKGHLAYFIE